ncbi:hypothetical protein HYH02_013953 [Chlamydomonas schloesseri]|uniref:GED domain-containing protein n=1 Tax=Chlamydomonas schloesseri TaxID=2026947 RepID=A0A835T0C7_9CHLO|nr:hypothetical protein HYH02_013953 [Chlamydomonas schloesseri]|eukprot:KAG2429695.1 hypothetical protein HYH02_013953 [Chlamydomonas schloesseri]
MVAAGTDGGPLAATKYHRVASRVLGLANQLRALGVDSALQVPTLVIAGDQSSGKSSVVEAIAGVPLPRSDGTCTRCPTEVRMRAQPPHPPPPIQPQAGGAGAAESPAGPADGDSTTGDAANKGGAGRRTPWKCHIKLCRDYDSDGKPLPKKPPEELFCTVADKAHVALGVSAAQAVLLNPRAAEAAPGGARAFVPPELGGGGAGCQTGGHKPTYAEKLRALGTPASFELAFTPNKVVLEIDGAEADLTIIDLPGIIHDHSQGPHLVEVVKHMVKAALAPAHHIIAMALPAGLDPETQAIRLWAREADPDGHRSIGIITKPDTIPEDAHIGCSKLVRLVGARGGAASRAANSSAGAAAAAAVQPPAAAADGGQHLLRLGYYVVKNPSQEQLAENITFEEARAAEARYFAGHKHWRPAMAAPATAQRLGAKALRDGLSALLVERIEEQLPAMRTAAREQLDAVRAEVAALPPPVEDARRELDALLWRVADTLAAHAQGDSRICGDCDFYQRTTAHYREYGGRAVRAMPAFLVGTTLISALNKADMAMHGGAEGGGAAAGGSRDRGAGGAAGGACQQQLQQQQQQRAWDEGEVDLASLPGLKAGPHIKTDDDAHEALLSDGEVQALLAGHLFPHGHMTLGEVTAVLRKRLGRELPGFCPYTAMEELLRRFKGQWRDQAEACLGEVAAAAHALAGKVVLQEFSRYPKGVRAMGAALSRHVEGLVEGASRRLEQLLGMEAADVYTLDTAHLARLQAAFLARLKRAYVRPRGLDGAELEEVESLLSQLTSYGARFATFDAAFLAQPTPVDGELLMAASCLAYFKVAFKRVQDAVPLTIRDALLGRLGSRAELLAALQQEVGDVTAAAPQLLDEDVELAVRRQQCTDRERRLREALTVLNSPAAQL